MVGRSLQQTIDAALAAEVSELAAFVQDYGEAVLHRSSSPPVRFRFAAGYFEVTRPSGEIVMASEALGGVRLPATPTAASEGPNQKTALRTQQVGPLGRLRIAARTVDAPGLGVVTIQTAMPMHQTETTVRRLAPVLALCAVLACCGTTAAGWLVAAWVVAPVRHVARTARRVSGEDLGARVVLGRSEEEIRELVDTFNGMLDRLQAALEQARRFSADASHELRTPLAVIRGEVEVALERDRSESEYRALLRSVLEEVEALSRLVSDLLDLSRADAGATGLSCELVDLAEIAESTCDRFETRFAEAGGSLIRRWSGSFPIVADPVRVRQLLGNLLDNAAKYAAHAGPVSVEVDAAGQGIECRVT
ncbi:MAG TPA: histidine kinase dimerization/phospho-acceptor domain-containing protein, partial [Armatimonadota bacterium]|nr:histidine kinase dimerization/phospho-acceptor domain-containing protein [Armatimonadota bacterium]